MASEPDQECLLSDDLKSSCEAPNTSSKTQQTFHQFAQLLDTKLDQKLASFKRSFEEKDAIHASERKKLKAESKASSSLKYKGNRIQYEFNISVLDGLQSVKKCLFDGNLSKASAEVDQQTLSLEKRNKLIRFADKSPGGWAAVEEYESNDLAENSDDEKKLRSAERRAVVKMKQNISKRGSQTLCDEN